MLNRRQARSQPAMGATTFPAPTKGLQLKKGIASLKSDEALLLDNWLPKSGYVQVRGGYTSHATGIGASIGSLMEWAGPASRKFFAANATDIYEVSSSGAVGAASLSSLTSAYWQYVNFTTAGGAFLVACNGSDDVVNYDGTSWTTPAITGVDPADLINVAVFKKRLWFVEQNSTKAWCLGVSSIAGAATALQLGDDFQQGGKLMLIGTLSRDAGNGAPDVICFISSKGEIVAYQGSDPADADTWSQIGRYMAAPPVGNRSLIRVDGDLGLLTSKGVLSLRQVAAGGLSASDRGAITGNIDEGIIEDVASYGGLTGWEMIVHPPTRQLIINVPLTNNAATATQYAMNTQTGGWCTYGRYASPMNATCWGIFNDDLYFGTAAGTVYQAANGYQDAGAEITAQLKTSFQNVGGRGKVERFTLVKPMFTAGGQVLPAIRINVDFRNDTPMSTDEFPGTSGSAGAVWDTALWDAGIWGDADQPYGDWIAAQGIGDVCAINMIVRPSGMTVKLNAFSIRYEDARGVSL
jgi:hypothetical protein